jgi:RND family efflux transporter MFP subunit
VHPGALASPASGPLVELEQLHRLRLVVAVPESEAAAIPRGARISFTVAAWPGRQLTGVVARSSGALDPKTRTMPVEADVANTDGALAPGMYAETAWSARRGRPSLMVPATGVAATTERTFVIRLRNGKAEWVNVTRGAKSGDLVEVLGALAAGDTVVKRATDELREGTPLKAK